MQYLLNFHTARSITSFYLWCVFIFSSLCFFSIDTARAQSSYYNKAFTVSFSGRSTNQGSTTYSYRICYNNNQNENSYLNAVVQIPMCQGSSLEITNCSASEGSCTPENDTRTGVYGLSFSVSNLNIDECKDVFYTIGGINTAQSNAIYITHDSCSDDEEGSSCQSNSFSGASCENISVDPTPTPTPLPVISCDAGSGYQVSCAGDLTSVEVSGSATEEFSQPTYLWSTTCPNGSFSMPNSASSSLIFTPYNSNNTPALCQVTLQVSSQGSIVQQCSAPVSALWCTFDCSGTLNGSSKLDRCGVCNGNGKSCLGCSSNNITTRQAKLDGAAARQRDLVFKSATLLIKNNPSHTKIRQFAQKAIAKANQLYLKNWVLTWSLPSVSLSCTSTISCTSVSTNESIDGYINTAMQLRKTLTSVTQKGQTSSPRLSRRWRRFNELSLKVFAEAKQNASGLPSSISSCS
jgi:hypothetical protein